MTTFSKGQQSAIDQLSGALRVGGQTIFLTGKAGTGKSTIIRQLRAAFPNLIALASTGIAGVNIGAPTVHSFFRLKIGPQNFTRASVAASAELIYQSDGFLIEEVSMVPSDVIDMIDHILRKTLGNDRPFGGKTMIFVGDPYQLGPVDAPAEKNVLDGLYLSRWFFDSNALLMTELRTITLDEVFRQSDPEFLDALNAVREGRFDSLDVFNGRVGDEIPDAIRLTFTNSRAHAINIERLTALEGGSEIYEATIAGDFGSDLPTDDSLLLKVGARVMVCRNFRDSYGDLVANGAMGRVEELGDHPKVVLDDGRLIVVEPVSWEKFDYALSGGEITAQPIGTFTQIPLKLAYAVTVHKSQGQTLDRAVLEFERPSFAHGQVYVALSRVRSLEGLFLRRRIRDRDIQIDPRVADFMARQRIPLNQGGAS